MKAPARKVLAEWEQLGTAQNVKVYRRHGAGENVYGVSFANLGELKKRIGVDHELALELWQSGNADAQALAAMISDPALGLDVVMRREFLDVMIDLLSERGVSVLFSSHVLTDVERIADRVGVLKGGRLIVDSTIVELRERVQRRFWAGGNGTVPQAPVCDGLLRAQRTRDGYQLTLLDLDEKRESALRADGAKLSAAVVPSLEDLFVDLTSGEDRAFVSLAKEDK